MTNAPDGRYRPTLLTVLVAGVVVAVVSSLGVYLVRRDSSPSSSESATPAASASRSLSERDQATDSARRAYRKYRGLVDAAFKNDAAARSQLGTIATGAALEGQQMLLTKIVDAGSHQIGDSELVSLVVTDVSLGGSSTTGTQHESKPTVHVTACVDFTHAYAVDKNGQSLRSPGTPMRWKYTGTVVKTGDTGGVNGWFVSGDADAGNQC